MRVQNDVKGESKQINIKRDKRLQGAYTDNEINYNESISTLTLNKKYKIEEAKSDSQNKWP